MQPKPPPPMTRYQFLAEVHTLLGEVENYLEIGVQTGASLALAGAAGTAWGIDPAPVLQPEYSRPNQRVKAQTADEFFDCQACERPTIDFAFIDGSHLFEDALRDFVNVQAHSHKGTIVIFDDVLPYNQDIAWRHQPPGDWTGDVFKIPHILERYQPELRGMLVDVQPTGALVVWGLDPREQRLQRAYPRILDEYLNGTYEIPADQVTGATRRHWNYVPAEVLARSGAISPRVALQEIANAIKAGEVGKGKVHA